MKKARKLIVIALIAIVLITMALLYLHSQKSINVEPVTTYGKTLEFVQQESVQQKFEPEPVATYGKTLKCAQQESGSKFSIYRFFSGFFPTEGNFFPSANFSFNRFRAKV